MPDKQLASSREQARQDEIEGFRPWQTALSKPLRVTLANGPAGCRGGFETGLPNVTFETHKKELGDSSQRGHCRHLQPKIPGRALEPGQRPCRLPRRV